MGANESASRAVRRSPTVSRSFSAMLTTILIVGSACSSDGPIGLRADDFMHDLIRADSRPRVGSDVWQTFVCRIPARHDEDLYDMSGVRLVESAEWIANQLEPVADYFDRWSNGRYVVEFRRGGEVHVDVGRPEECVDAAIDSSGEDVDGVVVVADAQHREDRLGGWGRGGHRCDDPCSARESKRAVYLGAADFVGSAPVVLDLVEHEFGHALDWPHSFRYGSYDSGIDVMSDSAAPRRVDGTRVHAPGVLAINRYLSGWMEREALALDSAGGGPVEIDSARFALVQTASARAVSIEVIDRVSDNVHLDEGGVAVHLIDWGPGSCESTSRLSGISGQFCLGAARAQRLVAPENSRDGVMRSGDLVDVDGVTIVVESITETSGSISASIRWRTT